MLLSIINCDQLRSHGNNYTNDRAALAMARDASRVLNLCVDVLQVGTCQQQPSAVCH